MMEAGSIYEGVSFRRTIALIGTNLLVFLDQIESDREHVYDLAYHNRGLAHQAKAEKAKAP